MSRICELTGIGVATGNRVSHSQRKTRRRFLPNLHVATFISDALGRKFRFRVTPKAMRTVEVHGGLDNYLISAKACALSESAMSVKRLLVK